MALEKLKKYQDVLSKHLKFFDEFELEDKKDIKHVEKVKRAISILTDSLESKELDTLLSARMDLEKSLKKIEELEQEAAKATATPSGDEEAIRAELEKEYGELIDELEKENERLERDVEAARKGASREEGATDEEFKAALAKIESLEAALNEAKSKAGAHDEEMDLETVKQSIRAEVQKEFRKQIESLKKRVAEAEKGVATPTATASEEASPSAPAEKPEDYHDVAGWEAYLEENPEDEEAQKAIQHLEHEAREEGNFRLLSEVLIVRFDFGIFETNEEAIAMIKEVSRINEIELGDNKNAFFSLKLLFDEHPEDEALLKDLQRIAGEGNIWDVFVEELQDTIEKVASETTEEVLGGLWLAVARAYNERLKQPEQAITALEMALKENPTMAEALEEQAHILKVREQWPELIKVLERLLKLTKDNDEKAFYLKEIASVKERKMGDPIMAARTYEEVFSLVPDDLEAITALETIYASNDLYEPLAAVLQRRVESVDNPEDARIARRDLGFLYAKELDDHNRAIDILEHLVEVLDTDIKLHRVLAELYEGTGRTRGYLKTATRLAELTEVEGEKITLYKRIATEYQLSPTTRVKAAEAYEKVLEIKPDEEDVYGALEELYLVEELFEELADLLSRHIKVVEAKSTKATLYRRLGEVFLRYIDEPERAQAPLEASYELNPNNMETMKLLSKCLFKLNLFEQNVPVLEALVERLEGEERQETFEWLGYSLLQSGELERAEEALHKALAIDQESFIALSSLGEIYSANEQWTRAVSYYERALKATKNRMEQGELVFKAASLLSDHLKQTERAVALYEELLEIDPGHPKAVRVLVEFYSKNEQWEKAAPLLHILTTEASSLPKAEQVTLFITAGRVALAVDQVERAAEYLESARGLEPTSLDVLLELAELRYRRSEWDGALSLYQALLVAHRDRLTTDKIAEIYTKLGAIKESKGDTLKAISFYDKALEVDPGYDAAAEAVLRLREDNEDYETVAKIKRNKINAESDVDTKLEMMSDLIRFYVDTVKDPEAAIELQQQALDLRPEDRGLLNDALDLYHLCERWDRVVQTVLKLADLEEPGLLRSKYHYSAGLIYLNEIGDDDRALEEFNNCLDQDPENEEVFEKVMEVHKLREDWHNLAKAIRLQLKRNESARGNITLWDTLGTIYMDQMGDDKTAIAAFEAAAKLEPTQERLERLIQLYMEGGEAFQPKAQQAMFSLLQSNPQNIPVIRSLFDLAKARQEKDKVLGLCGALSLYKAADEKEELFFKKFTTSKLRQASSILTDDLWLKLQSPEESHDLNTILAGLGHHLSIYYAVPHRDFGLSRKQAIQIDKDPRDFVKAYEYVSKTLLIKKRPELYAKEGLPIMIQLANTKEGESLIPSWLIEEKRFTAMSPLEAAYHFARELPFLRPERLFRREAPAPVNLMDAIYASFKVLVPNKAPASPKGREEEIGKLMKHVEQHVPAATLDSLKKPAKRFMKSDFESSVRRWIQANHKTSIRAAALITADLKHTLGWIIAEQDNVTGLRAKERVAEVMRFVLSNEYYELRERLGLNIK